MRNTSATWIIILIIVCSISTQHPLTSQSSVSEEFENKKINATVDVQEEPNLPNKTLSLLMENGPFGQVVNATLTIEFGYFFDGNIGIGYRQEYLSVRNMFGCSAILGLGWDEMREYPFLYYSDGEYTDYWVNRTSSWTSFRPRPAWTSTSRSIAYAGYAPKDRPPYNATQVVFAGDIIEFENLTIYFADGTSFLCGPRQITIGANFTQTEEGWITESIINITDDYPVTVEDTTIRLALSRFVPLDLPTVGVVGSVVVVLALVFHWSRKMDKKMPKDPTTSDDKDSQSEIGLG